MIETYLAYFFICLSCSLSTGIVIWLDIKYNFGRKVESYIEEKIDSKIFPNKRAISRLKYYLVWSTKHGRKLLPPPPMEIRLKEILYKKANELDLKITSLETSPSHIVCIIETHPNLSIQFIINQLKEFSAKQLREEFFALRIFKSYLWSNSYLVQSVGDVSEKIVQQYIENQKIK